MGRATYQPVSSRRGIGSSHIRSDRRAATDSDNHDRGLPIFLKRVARAGNEPSSRLLQAKLKVGHPHSVAETEADRAADQIVDEPLEGQAPTESLARRGEGCALGGEALPRSLQRSMESRFEADFSGVRVHRDAGADAAARAVDARAFTVGGDVTFASNEFQPETTEGQRLLAHELAHVVQQSGGSRAGAGAPELHAAEPSLQRTPVRTMGGEWDTSRYNVVKDEAGTTDIGVEITLNFKPEDPVNAELIGLTQTARAVEEGTVLFPNKTVKDRSIPTGEEAEGTRMDQLAERANPLYAAETAGATDTLADTPTNRRWGRHGYHYIDAMGYAQHQEAILHDTPTIPSPGKNAGHNFETAALAVKGDQEGTFYGSVKWGWHNRGGTVQKMPLELGSVGVPSATYMRAAQLWNKGKTSTDAETLDLPTSKLPTSTILPSARSTSDLVFQIAKVNAELGKMSPGTDKTNKEFEKKALEFELAKRTDQPTLSLADQEKAAGLLSTPNLIRRADALRTELPRTAAGTAARTDKELEQDAVRREIAKRKVLITVHVHETGDTLGADSVYVTALSMALRTTTSIVDLNNGQAHTFVVPLSTLLPPPPATMSAASVFFRAYDSDWEGDDLMFDRDWMWTDLPASATQSREGGKYTVSVGFPQVR